MSIRKRLLLLLAAATVLPALAIIAISYHHARNELIQTRLDELRTIADLKAEVIRDFHRRTVEQLERSGENSAVGEKIEQLSSACSGSNPAECLEARTSMDRQFRLGADLSGYSDFMVILPDSRIIYDSNRVFPGDLTGTMAGGTLLRAFNRGKQARSQAGGPSWGRAGEVIQYLTLPVRGPNGDLRAVLVMATDARHLFSFIQDRIGLGETGETLVGELKGATVAFLNPLRHDQQRGLQRTLPLGSNLAFPVQAAAGGNSGSGESVDYRGVPVLAAWQYVDPPGWGLVAKMDRDEALTGLAELRMKSLGLAVAFLLLSVLAGDFLARRMAEPLLELRRAVDSVGEGDLDHRINSPRSDELGDFAREFDAMAERLQTVTASRDDLEQAYNDREQAQSLSRIGTWSYDVATDRPRWSREMFRIFGVDPQAGEPSWEEHRKRIHPNDWDRLDRAVQAAVSEGRPYREEFRIVLPDENQHWGITIGQPAIDESGKVTSIIGTVQDITEIRRIEADLADRERKFRLLAEAIEDVFWISTPGVGQSVYVSPAYEKVWGGSLKDFETNPQAFLDYVHPEDRPELTEVYQKAHARQRPYSAQYRIIRPDGEVRWIHERGYAGPEDPDLGPLMAGVCRDVTTEVQERLAREKSEKMFRQAEALADIGAWEWDLENDSFTVSEGWKRLHGYAEGQLDRETLKGLAHPEDRDRVFAELNGVAEGEKDEYVVEHRIIRADDGQVRYVRARGGLMTGPDGSRLMYGTSQDITERALAQQEMRQFEWLLEKSQTFPEDSYDSPYPDLTGLNTSRVILDAVGKNALHTMARDLVDLLDTSVAVYEANGDYAYGYFKSGWCRMMDSASFARCRTEDTRRALDCGKWLCHENCWNDSARAAIESGAPTDIECVGGIRLYAAPVFAGGEVVGAVNMGYSTPPRDDKTVGDLAEKFRLDPARVLEEAKNYKPRPEFIIELAKRRCQGMARLIGETVELKRAEQKVRASEQRLREEKDRAQLYLDIAEVMLVGLDQAGRITLINRRGAEVLGFEDRDSLLGQDWFQFIPPQDRDWVWEIHRSIMGGKDQLYRRVEGMIVTATGESRIILWSNSAVIGPQGEIVGSLSSGQDVTELKQTEAELQQTLHRKRLALQASNVGLYDWDIRTNEVYFSPEWMSQVGYEGDELPQVFDTWEQRLHPDDRERVLAEVDNYLRGRTENYRVEFRLQHRDGNYRWIMAVGEALRDDLGKPYRMTGCHVDLTEQKLAEEQKDALEQQLVQAQRMEAIGRLAGGVAHDFNNALTPMLIVSDVLLKETSPSDPIFDDLTEIKRAGERCASLTRQLLAFSRRQPLDPTNVNLNEVVVNMQKMLSRLIGEHIDLVIDLAPELGTVSADVGQMEQIIVNLAVNARDAMPGGGKLTIGTKNLLIDEHGVSGHPEIGPGEYAMIEVSDTGEGMDRETREKIFEPFFTTKEQGQGTGLGLSTVYGIVKQSGGDIWCYSETGLGSTFKIVLPVIQAERKPVREDKASTGQLSGDETILVVEDDPNVRKAAVRILSGNGYRVLDSGGAEDALAMIESQDGTIHLVVTDVVMPNMNGRELADRILEKFPGIKTLFVSGYTADLIARHGVLEPGIDFLEKPFTEQSLLSKVRKILDRDE